MNRPVQKVPGLRELKMCGYNEPKTVMIIEYALMRRVRGEGKAALRGATDRSFYGISLRDAAHEAHHALRGKLRRSWNRETIHSALVDLCDSSAPLLVAEELDARAVEWAVCEAHGVAYDLDHWSCIAGLEAMHVGIAMPHDAWRHGIEVRRGTPDIIRASRAVLNLKTVRARASTRSS